MLARSTLRSCCHHHVPPCMMARGHRRAALAASAGPDSRTKESSFVVGPLFVKNVPGKGRGIFAAEEIHPGQLLLVCDPIVAVSNRSSLPEIPETEELLQELESKELTDKQRAWLKLLVADSSMQDSGGTPPGDLFYSDASEPTSDSTHQRRTLSEEDVPKELRLGLLDLNMFGGECSDIILCTAQEEELVGSLGLYPQFSFFNHSCAPGATNYTIGPKHSMVVRATRQIPQGAEVCINYLGSGIMAPVADRQQALFHGYGFECGCERCCLDSAPHFSAVSREAEAASMLASELLPQLQEAMAGCAQAQQEQAFLQHSRPPEGVHAPGQHEGMQGQGTGGGDAEAQLRQQAESACSQLQEQLKGFEQHLEAALRDGRSLDGMKGQLQGLSQQRASKGNAGTPLSESDEGRHLHDLVLRWLQGSAYQAYGLLALAAEFTGISNQVLLSGSHTQLEAAAAVAPGSDLHVFLALRMLSLQQQHAAATGSTDSSSSNSASGSASRHLVDALSIRYGPGGGEEQSSQKQMQHMVNAAVCAMQRISAVDLLIPVQVSDADWDEEDEE